MVKKFIFSAFLITLISQSLNAKLLFDYNIQEEWGTPNPISTVNFGLGNVIGGVMPNTVLLWYDISPDDSGSSIDIFESMEPDNFNTMVSLLTNGLNDEIFFLGSTSGTSEMDYALSGGPSDFIGLEISYFSLLVHDLTITDNGSLNWISSNVSIQAWAVPEPATVSLLALGGLALLRKRKQ